MTVRLETDGESGRLSPAERAERARLRTLPAFPEAALRAARGMANSYRGNLLLARLLNDRGRVALGLMMLSMHFESGPEARGLTTGRLKAEAAALGVCSPGRVAAVVATFRLLGLLAPAPDADRRRRRLVATERFIALHRQRWRSLFEPLVELWPEAARALTLLEDDRFVGAFVDTLLEPFRNGWRLVDEVPALRGFADRDGGLVIALELYDAARSGTPRSISQIARTYRVSRSHVLGILRGAAEVGLVRRIESTAGTVEALPTLADALDHLAATAFVRHTTGIRRGYAAVDGTPPP
ncbi:hypothetical protein [Ancylobacter lacus]|uniref:hypothetical protein n=1 Tax=Ancylobacter lacus TaxID=2579970 RepID=UPI001BCDB1F6|nr:hypothetical protein [Ancylobacter lacus]MBS7541421.1 hypothetical protein [Ancylobacter lacus]